MGDAVDILWLVYVWLPTAFVIDLVVFHVWVRMRS